MNKRQLINATALATGMTKKDSERVLNTALELITAALGQGEKVQLSGFGSFEVKHREARVARNLHTRESIEVPATDVPTFKPSNALKKVVAE